MVKIFVFLIFIFSSLVQAKTFSIDISLHKTTIDIYFEKEERSTDFGHRLKVDKIFLAHPDLVRGKYGKIVISTKKTSTCSANRNDWGHLVLQRGAELPALIFGPYQLIIDGEMVQIVDWTIRGGCETGNGAPKPCF